MYYKPFIVFVLAIGVLGAGAVFAPFAAVAQAPRAKILSIEGETTTYQVEDKEGKLVEVDVPSSSSADVRTRPQSTASTGAQSGQGRRTVAARVVAVDSQTNQVRVVTQTGQTIQLEMATQDLQIGDQFTLVVP